MIHGVLQCGGDRNAIHPEDIRLGTITLTIFFEYQLVIPAMTDEFGDSAPSIGNAGRWPGRGSSQDGFHRSLFAGAVRRYDSR